MQYRVILCAVVFTACSTAPVVRSDSAAVGTARIPAVEVEGSSADAVQFLLTAAATDFHNSRSPRPAGFRNVRAGHVITADGEKQYMLCGQFLAQDGGETNWADFATIKTSGYEQWLGLQAEGLCRRKSIVWEEEGDLSSPLQSQLDSLR